MTLYLDGFYNRDTVGERTGTNVLSNNWRVSFAA